MFDCLVLLCPFELMEKIFSLSVSCCSAKEHRDMQAWGNCYSYFLKFVQHQGGVEHVHNYILGYLPLHEN
jgi:hypothetical protein